MKLSINKADLNEPPQIFLRRAGYTYINDRHSGQDSFVRRLGRDFYPRFHVYIIEEGGMAVFNLHLDQKKPSYAGAHAHNAEYDGEAVEAEIERLKREMEKNIIA